MISTRTDYPEHVQLLFFPKNYAKTTCGVDDPVIAFQNQGRNNPNRKCLSILTV